MMKILAIETSCDETAVAIVDATDDGRFIVRASAISSQIALHEQYGGVVPSLAAREHAANIEQVFAAALTEAAVTDPERSINLIAVTRGPGLGPALLVGLTFARTLAWKWGTPIVGVNHMDGHIFSNWLTARTSTLNSNPATPPPILFPALNIVVSGGHTDLVYMDNQQGRELVGETHDDAIGEAFDKVARLLGLPYPGGPKISKLAAQGNPTAYTLPRPMHQSNDFDVSYSGLKTAVLYLIRDLTGGTRELTEQERADIAASFQVAAIDTILIKAKRAAQHFAVKSLLLSGGVSANTLLRERVKALAYELSIPAYIPDLAYTTDNAAMIAVAGFMAYQSGQRDSWEQLSMDANLHFVHNLQQ